MLTDAHLLRSFRRKSVRKLGVQPCIIYCLRELPTHLYFLYLYEKYIFNFCPVLDWTYRGFYHSFYYFWPYALRIIQGFSVIEFRSVRVPGGVYGSIWSTCTHTLCYRYVDVGYLYTRPRLFIGQTANMISFWWLGQSALRILNLPIPLFPVFRVAVLFRGKRV